MYDFEEGKEINLIFNKNKRLLDLAEQLIDALTRENLRLSAENSKLQDKLISFCGEAFNRMKGFELQEKKIGLGAKSIKDKFLEDLGQPKTEEEEKEIEEAKMVLNHTLGLS